MTHKLRGIVTTVVAFAFVFLLGVPPFAAAANALVLQPVAGQAGEFIFGQQVDGSGPITIQSRFSLDKPGNVSKLDSIWLAGFGSEPDTPPSLLSLVWTKDTSGWFPTWNIQLQGAAALFPADVRLQAMNNRATNSYFFNLSATTPEPGDVIESVISFDPATGRVDVSLIDAAANKRLASKTFHLAPHAGVLYPAAGIAGEYEEIQLLQFDVQPYGVPVGVPWNLLIEEGGQYKSLLLRRLVAGNALALQVGAAKEQYTGRYVLAINDGVQQKPLAELLAADREQDVLLPISPSMLPMGKFDLQFNWVDENDNVWTMHSIPMHVVAANVHVGFALYTFDGDTVRGMMTISSEDGVMQQSTMRLKATEIELDDNGRQVRKTRTISEFVLDNISGQPIRMPIEIPVFSNDDIFGFVLDAEFNAPVGLTVSGGELYLAR